MSWRYGDESILANPPVHVDNMAWRTFHRGDRGLPVSRLEHAAHAHGRFVNQELSGMLRGGVVSGEGLVAAKEHP